jgi:hypothetical protein
MCRKLILAVLVLALVAVTPSFAGRFAVYAMTNPEGGPNEIAIYHRFSNGAIAFSHLAPTGGLGACGVPCSPEDALGSQNPLIMSENRKWLFAVNAGSDTISVFRARGTDLILVDIVWSGGDFPVSLTQREVDGVLPAPGPPGPQALTDSLIYVLNAGGSGNISGFRQRKNGTLKRLGNSTRDLGQANPNPPFFLVSPAQVGFGPKDSLIVTIKGLPPAAGVGTINVYRMNARGRPSAYPVTTISNGTTPFGFGIARNDRLLVAEAFGNSPGPAGGAGAVSSYRMRNNHQLVVNAASVDNFQTATCWLAAAKRGQCAYATNNGSMSITGYKVGKRGQLSLVDPGGVTGIPGLQPVDAYLTTNGRLLYTTNAGAGTVSAFRVNRETCALTLLSEVGGLPLDPMTGEAFGAVGVAVR